MNRGITLALRLPSPASLILFYPVMLMIPIALKWLVIGRYKPGACPLWGTYYLRWWLVTTIEAAVPVSYLAGTPLLNIYLRLVGAKVGRNVHLDSDGFCIYDLLGIGDDSSVGDETALNADCTVQTHLFEDRVMKMSCVHIGPRCTVGAGSLVLYDSRMAPGAALDDLSLLMKGETLPARTRWQGIPAKGSHPSD